MSSALDQFEEQLVAASRTLSDEHVASTTTHRSTASPRGSVQRRRWGWRGSPRRLTVSLAALVIAGGGVAAAHSLIWPSQRLANGTVDCFIATHGTPGTPNGTTLAVSSGHANGQSPIAYCQHSYAVNHDRLNGKHSGPHLGALVATLPRVACQDAASIVGVYVANGDADQCRSVGGAPLPATYDNAAARLRRLQASLLAVEKAHDCPSPATIARHAEMVLTQQGFTGWRVISAPARLSTAKRGYPAGTGGTCGSLTTGFDPPTNVVALSTARHTVSVSLAPPRSIARATSHAMTSIVAATSHRCYTPSTIRTLINQAFSTSHLAPRFAIVAGQAGVTYSPPPAEHLYQRGCVRGFLAIPENDDRHVDVILNSKNAPRLPHNHFFPPARAFHR